MEERDETSLGCVMGWCPKSHACFICVFFKKKDPAKIDGSEKIQTPVIFIKNVYLANFYFVLEYKRIKVL